MSTIELARFTVRPEDAEAMLAARPGMEEALRTRMSGFRSLRLVRLDERTWLDVVEWATRQDADAAAAAVADVPEIAAVFGFIDSVISMEHGELVEGARV